MNEEPKFESNYSAVWKFVQRACGGLLGGVFFIAGFLDDDCKEHAVVCSVWEGQEFPRDVLTSFKRNFLLKATCARCGNQQSELKLRILERGSKQKKRPFVVCNCGHPVWKITPSAFYETSRAMVRPEYERRRKERLTAGGAKHTRSQVEEILAIQEHRCIYCNRRFENGFAATIDHLLPVSLGGTDWALNILMACHACNSRRGTTPFRTYCKTLSPTQNRRILSCLIRRMISIREGSVQEREFAIFVVALRMHNPRDRSYRWLLAHSEKCRKYASENLLLPTVTQLLKRMTSLYRREAIAAAQRAKWAKAKAASA